MSNKFLFESLPYAGTIILGIFLFAAAFEGWLG